MLKLTDQPGMQPMIPILMGLAVLNAMLPSVLLAIDQSGFTSAFLSGFNQSGVTLLSLAVTAHMLLKKQTACQDREPDGHPVAHRTLPLWLISCSLLLVVPLASLSWLVVAALAIYWRKYYTLSSDQKAACVLLCAIALRGPVTQVCLTLFSSEILNFDTQAAALLLQLHGTTFSVTENVITNADGHSLLILTGCSVFTNLSLAMLLWLSVTLLCHTRLQATDTWRLAGVVAIQLSLNTARLAMMATDITWYRFLHEGFGETLFEWSTLLMALLFVNWRTSDESSRDRTAHISARHDSGTSHPSG